MEKIEFDNLETGDQIKVAINVIISRYNKLKDIPRFLEYITPIMDSCIGNDNVTNVDIQLAYEEIKKSETKIINQLKQLQFEFDMLISYFASNYFMSLKQQKEIFISDEKEELIIKFDLNKFVEKFNSLDPRLFANIKNQLIDVIKIENSMIEEQNNLFYQYEKIVNLKRGTKGYDEDSGGYIKKSTSYKTLLFDQ